MRWLSQRTPTIDEDRLYATTAQGDLVCLRVADGKELWRKSYPRDFQGKRPSFAYCDRPLVDGDRLVCMPGGSRATVVALNKRDGSVLWQCAIPGDRPAGHAAMVVVEVGGTRQYVAFPLGAVVGIRAGDGALLWRYEMVTRIANAHTPLVQGDLVLCGSAYGTGLALLRLLPQGRAIRVQEVYRNRQRLAAWHDNMVLVEGHVYLHTGFEMVCLELNTGRVVWKHRDLGSGKVSSTCADGHLYLRNQEGEMALVEATPTRYTLKGTFQIPGAVAKMGSTAPVVTGGRLYLRDDDVLFCYDVREGAAVAPGSQPKAAPTGREDTFPGAPPQTRPSREPDAVFVPTPQDVVEKMLDLVDVKRGDVVYDLGCGDGRIVVTAARKYGCQAVGYDLDPECVKMARASVAQGGVGRLVTIEQKDLFTADLARADVVTLYLLPRLNEKLITQLERLKPGARVVSHQFAIPGVRPNRVVTCRSGEDGLEHKLYLWTTPLHKVGQKK